MEQSDFEKYLGTIWADFLFSYGRVQGMVDVPGSTTLWHFGRLSIKHPTQLHFQ